jgi:aspartyl-tRNA(Asn)/glutamyl-tRNA(Gln) amidotransferase subunit B
MVNSMTYETIIGLEVHIELATVTKIFCGCPTLFGQPPNTQCCPVCLGLPGSLPVLNRTVLLYSLRACLATGCSITPLTRFDRKNYFYPDLPKAYQITQWYQPVGQNGQLRLPGSGRLIGIREIHMEEDAGKLIHDDEHDCTLIDYNRSGVPLLEIVSQPELRSADEALLFLETLRRTLIFTGISDCRMQEGSLRADVNVSVRPAGSSSLGTRTEIKNLSSYKAIGRAILSESKRQADLLRSGRPVRQETRRWDEDKNTSRAMRSKEEAGDYRYFPDPDLAVIPIDADWLQSIRASLPEMPGAKQERFRAMYALTDHEADLLTSDPVLAKLFEDAAALSGRAKETATWIMGELLQICKKRSCHPGDLDLAAADLATIVTQVAEGRINRGSGRDVLIAVVDRGADPVAYIRKQDLHLIDQPDELEKLVAETLRTHQQAVFDFRSGKEKTLIYLVGQVMRCSKGKADPQAVTALLKEFLQN